VVPREAPLWVERQWLRREHLLDHVVTGRPVEALLADRGDLAQSEGRILGLERDDGLPDLVGQPSLILPSVFPVGEEAAHSEGVESSDLAAQSALRDARLAGATRDRLPKQHDRA
jgi:hypothetical protein